GEQIERGARRLTHNRYDAEDLVQETLLKAYSGFHTFKPGSNARAWLFRIMYNTWINSYRTTQRRPEEVLAESVTDAQLAAALAGSPIELASAELAALESMGDDEVRRAMEALPDFQRVIVYYADVACFRYKEIAELMDIPVGTVMSRLHRARRNLRKLLAETAVARGYLARSQDNGTAA
ncbi:RNA polymerase subunit sigma, partial [Mycobacterium sp. E802]|uniref:sigma-70 family RNA polymerase sigma factor n=1 Tax=Mycobacterium sp. E802 TaxID=1834152 RepID=UPI0007FF31F0